MAQPTNDGSDHDLQTENYDLPVIWPPAEKSGGTDTNPRWIDVPGADTALTGIVWNLDSRGVDLLENLLSKNLKVKLAVVVYAASATTENVLQKLLELSSSSGGCVEVALMAIGFASNASPMTALCFSNRRTGQTQFWLGNSGDLGWEPSGDGHLNLAFQMDSALSSLWIEWFARFWRKCTPLTPSVTKIPFLVPVPGTQAAFDAWRGYEQLCCELSAPEPLGAQLILRVNERAKCEEERPDTIKLCRDLGLPVPDRVQETVARLLAKGQVVTIDKGSRTPPLELPIRAEWLRLPELGTKRISFKAETRIHIFDEKESKELENQRQGVTELIKRLTYPLADGVRWIPLAAQPLLEQERSRLEKEAKHRLGTLISGDVTEFVRSRRQQIEEEVNEVYTKFHPNERLPPGSINLILRDLEDRLVKATGENFLPKVSYATQQFSIRLGSEHVAQWAPARTLLGAIAKYARKTFTEKGYLRGHEIPERELLQAMDVCDDHILRTRHDSKTRHIARRELRLLDEILADDSDDRSKCARILDLIKGVENTKSSVVAAQREQST